MASAVAETITRSTSEYAQRARYDIPANVFKNKRNEVPAHVFIAERDLAFAEKTATGWIDLSLSEQLGFDFPATTPFLLARYARIRNGEQLTSEFKASGEIYYVIRGAGQSTNAADTIAWQAGDIFCFPGGNKTAHQASEDSILLLYTDEPLLSYTHTSPSAVGKAALATVHYLGEDIQRHLDAVVARGDVEDAAGQAVQFMSEPTVAMGTCLPTIALAINSLQPQTFQRPHIHNAVALTLCIEGQGCYSMIDGQRIDWQANALMVTPPTAVHSHHNEGEKMMRCLIAQDGGLYYHARTVGFSFAD